MIDIKIDEKYLYISENNKHIAYFENFETKKELKMVIKLASEDKEGDKFIKQNNYKIQYANVYWFSKKFLRYRVMFVEEKKGAFHSLILIVPKLLKI